MVKLKNKFEKDKQTSPWGDYLSFATGGPTGVLLKKDVKTKIADKLVAENPNIIKISDTKYINTETNVNEYNEIGKNKFATSLAKFQTSYFSSIINARKLNHRQKMFQYFTISILRPAWRLLGWSAVTLKK